MYVCTHVCMYVCTHVCMFVCFACLYVCWQIQEGAVGGSGFKTLQNSSL